jgi:hypothetical protein
VGVPDGGFELHVHTRFDEDVGVAGILDKHPVCVRRPGGVPLIMHLFCSTGGDLGGYHYDPLFSVSSARLIEELFGSDEQADEARRIAQRLEADDAQAEEVLMDDPELAEAKRLSLVGVEDAALQAALDMSMAGLSLGAVAANSSASGSGAAAQRHAAGQDARGRAVDSGGRAGGSATSPCLSASAGQARDARAVPASGQDTLGVSEAGAGVRRVQRRVGHSQVYDSDDGSKRGYRRLRRAATRAPTGDQETDRAVSQGLLAWDEAEDMSTHVGDTGTRAFEGGDGEVTPPCSSGSVVQSGLVTPPAGPSEAEGENAVEALPSPDPLRPYYSSPARRVSLVEEPSSPARPPMSTSGRGCVRRTSQMGAHVPRSESAGPEVVRRRSARIEARGQDAAVSRGVGIPAAAPTMSDARGGGRGRGRGKGAGA